MTKILATALLAILACTLGVHSMPREAVASATPVRASFDTAMPAPQEPQEPLDTTVITAVETVGASPTE